MSILEAISPTARELLRGEDQYVFTVRTRYYCGTNLANCEGSKASSTNCAAVAAENAAFKHFKKMCVCNQLDGRLYQCAIDELAGGVFDAIFTRRASETKAEGSRLNAKGAKS